MLSAMLILWCLLVASVILKAMAYHVGFFMGSVANLVADVFGALVHPLTVVACASALVLVHTHKLKTAAAAAEAAAAAAAAEKAKEREDFDQLHATSSTQTTETQQDLEDLKGALATAEAAPALAGLII